MKMELDEGAIVPVEPSRGIMERPYTGAEIKAQVNMIQEVMESVMKEGIHYGVIPGTGGKPTLLKPGSEKLNLTFRISPRVVIEDLSTPDEIHYRVISKAYHISSGDFLGDGVGEASSNEEKYKWRRAVVKAEFDETPEDRRREPYKKGQKGAYAKIKQVRTNPADIANTVLKMAKKRAQVDMTLTVLAASDAFSQDLEDMTDVMREALGQDEVERPKQPERKSEAGAEKKTPAKKATPPKKKATPPKKKDEDTPSPSTPPWEKDPDDPGPGEDQAPPAEEQEEEELPLGGEMVEEGADFFAAVIESVTSKKKGTGAKGDWELFRIDLSTGDNLSCFSKELVEEATKCCEEGVLCSVFYEENQYGYTLTAIEVVG